MRRGRPTAPAQQNNLTKPSPSPGRKAGADPFAALDSKSYDERAKAVDELSQKYPALDEFSLLSNKGSKFEFDEDFPKNPAKPSRTSDINQRVTNALADEAFATGSPNNVSSSGQTSEAPAPPKTTAFAKRTTQPSKARLSSSQPIAQPQPQRTTMVSTGTMTSRPSSPIEQKPHHPPKPSLEVWKVPNREESPRISSIARFDAITNRRSQVRDLSRSPQPDIPQSPASSRPSLEGVRPTSIDFTNDLHRSRSTHAAPEQQHHHRSSGLFRRGSSHRDTKRRSGLFSSTDPQRPPSPTALEETNIASDVDYLRVVEAENDASSKGHHRRFFFNVKDIKELFI